MRELRWLVPLAVLVVLGAAALAVYNKVGEKIVDLLPKHKVESAADGSEGAPQAFKTGVLELSTLKSPKETFRRTDRLTLWDLELGSAVSEVRVDATFRYHVPTDPRGWHVKKVGEVFRVIVPAVQPSLPVAIDTATMQKRTDTTWLNFSGGANLAALEKSLTEELAKRAVRPSYIEAQRQASREAAAEYVRRWLITQERWKGVKPAQVRVFFADEPIERMNFWETNF